MSFSDLFDNEFKSRNKGHFSSIVRVATADGTLSPEEKLFLDKLAHNLEISPLEYEEILDEKTLERIKKKPFGSRVHKCWPNYHYSEQKNL